MKLSPISILKRIPSIIIGFFVLLLLYGLHKNFVNFSNNADNRLHLLHVGNTVENNDVRDYYVHTSQCRMPRVDPYSPEIRKIFIRLPPVQCASDEALVESIYEAETQHYRLHINMTRAIEYASMLFDADELFTEQIIQCCYREIVRKMSNDADTDQTVNILDCTTFHQDFIVPTHVAAAIITCNVILDGMEMILQEDAFSFVQYKGRRSNRTSERKPSVLLLGIDSLSRFNFRRTMPLTFETMQKQGWHELEGFNKMGDNTFPNIMSLLTGYNETRAKEICRPHAIAGLDGCPFVWHRFKAAGYRTAYAEDTASISTFNFLKKGFHAPPTDHYLRPLFLAIETELPTSQVASLPFCVGRRQSGEYVYDFALQFTRTYVNEPKFGLFWTNSFSHNKYDVASLMDQRMMEYLDTFEREGVLNDAILILFSDHGMRFGSLLHLSEGFLEERLPMFFISLPAWLQHERPDFVRALTVNRNRLTTTYDVYLTLLQTLELGKKAVTSQRTPLPATADGCKRCQSILQPVPENRTCSDIGIKEHWCTCQHYERIPPTSLVSFRLATAVLQEINTYVKGRDTNNATGPLCIAMVLYNVTEVSIRTSLDYDYRIQKWAKKVHAGQQSYRIKMVAAPFGASFQATAVYDDAHRSLDVVVEDISRIDRYGPMSSCVNDEQLKKFCICSNYKGR